MKANPPIDIEPILLSKESIDVNIHLPTYKNFHMYIDIL